MVYLLDYVAGNIRSLVNAIEKLGYTVEWVRSPEDVPKADVRTNEVFPVIWGQWSSILKYISILLLTTYHRS